MLGTSGKTIVIDFAIYEEELKRQRRIGRLEGEREIMSLVKMAKADDKLALAREIYDRSDETEDMLKLAKAFDCVPQLEEVLGHKFRPGHHLVYFSTSKRLIEMRGIGNESVLREECSPAQARGIAHDMELELFFEGEVQ